MAAVLVFGVLGAALKLAPPIRGRPAPEPPALPLPRVVTFGLAGAAALIGVAFTGAGLTGAGLTGACLTGAGLKDAGWAGADWAGADLAETGFAGADLAGEASRNVPPAAPLADVAGSAATLSAGFSGAASAADFTCGSAPALTAASASGALPASSPLLGVSAILRPRSTHAAFMLHCTNSRCTTFVNTDVAVHHCAYTQEHYS